MKSKPSSRPSRVDPVRRNPFIPEASAAEVMRSMMVPREVKTGSRFRNDYDEVLCMQRCAYRLNGLQVKTIARNSNCEVCQCRKRFDGSLYAVKKARAPFVCNNFICHTEVHHFTASGTHAVRFEQSSARGLCSGCTFS